MGENKDNEMKHDISEDDKEVEYPDFSSAFETGEVFKNDENLVKWVRQVAHSQGHVLRILRSKKGGIGQTQKITLCCERYGIYKPKKVKLKYVTGSKKCNCPFKVHGRFYSDCGGWRVTVCCGSHNHEKCESFVEHSRVTLEEYEKIISMTKKGVAPRKILASLVEDNPDTYVTLKQIYNIRNKWRRELRQPRSQMQHLLMTLRDRGYDTWYTKDEATDVVKQIFWANPKSITLLALFNIVLIVDNTYKTNRYKWPLLEVVGQTSTDKSFTIAFSYMEAEQYPNFLWALEQVKKLFKDDHPMPKVIVSDFEASLVRAIETVFPTSTHLLCQFHIKKNVKSNLRKYLRNLNDAPFFENAWDRIVHSKDEDEYQDWISRLGKMSYKAIGFTGYLNRTYLKNQKEKFVEAWTRNYMHLGNTTTNRVEGQHANFKRRLTSSNGDFCKCLDSMHEMLTVQHREIDLSFQKSLTRLDHRVRENPLFQKIRYNISKEAINKIFTRLEKFDVDGSCDCNFRITHGLPCSCEVDGYRKSGQPIPLKAIHPHWKILTSKNTGKREEDTDLDPTPLIDEFWRVFKDTNDEGKRILMDKLREVVDPATTSLLPPGKKAKTKGRTSDHERSTKHDPSGWEYAKKQSKKSSQKASQEGTSKASEQGTPKASQEGTFSSSQKGTSKASEQGTPKPYQQSTPKPSQEAYPKAYQKTPKENVISPYLEQFPACIQPMIDKIVDVRGDGHCGYRSISLYKYECQESYMIVRTDLMNEMRQNKELYIRLLGEEDYVTVEGSLHANSTAVPRQKWLSLPSLGPVIANRYNVVFVSLTHTLGGCCTYLPYTKAPNMNPKVWVVGHVSLGGFLTPNTEPNHWIQVLLKEGSPLPTLYPGWNIQCNEDARLWVRLCLDRFALFREFFNPPPKREGGVVDVD